MTKEKIIDQVYQSTSFSKSKARNVVETILELMKGTLAEGEDILVSGFGKFMVKAKQARRGRNPQTRADLQLRARKVVVFKTSGVLRKRINHQETGGGKVGQVRSSAI
jgi:integration host factor subunit alpha